MDSDGPANFCSWPIALTRADDALTTFRRAKTPSAGANELGSAAFEAQYQQRPVPPEDNLVKIEWFQRYDDPPTRNAFEAVVQRWDTAMVPGEGNDYSVCLTWGMLGQRLYLLDVYREQVNYPDLRRAVVMLRRKFSAAMVIVEKAGSGISIFQDLRSDRADWIFEAPVRDDKACRLAQQSAKIEAGYVYLPKAAPWLSTFESEIAAFPNGKHDDQVDSLTQFLRASALGAALCGMFRFADEGEGKTFGAASTFHWTSQPKEALL